MKFKLSEIKEKRIISYVKNLNLLLRLKILKRIQKGLWKANEKI